MSGPTLVQGAPAAHPIKAWIHGVPVENQALQQLRNVASLPFIHGHVAAMPDIHVGVGATVGTVIPTKGAIVPAAVGVDIGCGMMALRTTLHANQLPSRLAGLRAAIEDRIPVGNGPGGNHKDPPDAVLTAMRNDLGPRLEAVLDRHPKLALGKTSAQLGTLGGGNHFIEICLDESQKVWVMLHSGSRGTGNVLGTYFIARAKELLEKRAPGQRVIERDLAYFLEGEPLFQDYVEAVSWAQDYARANRKIMMARILMSLREQLPAFGVDGTVVNCHHNYVARERHFGEDVYVTRKGAVRAGEGELGIIPGSMGTRSYIVRGKGNPDSFCSCSHGAGRRMSRTAARERFTVKDHVQATQGIECRKDSAVIDETPMAYKDIDAVMAAQEDLVETVHTLRQVVCVKG